MWILRLWAEDEQQQQKSTHSSSCRCERWPLPADGQRWWLPECGRHNGGFLCGHFREHECDHRGRRKRALACVHLHKIIPKNNSSWTHPFHFRSHQVVLLKHTYQDYRWGVNFFVCLVSYKNWIHPEKKKFTHMFFLLEYPRCHPKGSIVPSAAVFP